MHTDNKSSVCAWTTELMLLCGSFVLIVDQQKQIFHPRPEGIRKCVVATNIAATSLTINGIRWGKKVFFSNQTFSIAVKKSY